MSEDVFLKIAELLRQEETFAVLTVVGHRGSVPRRLAKMIVKADGKTYGTIGGGCMEGEAVATALKLLKEGSSGVRLLTLDLVEEEYGGVGMTCGGRVDIAIEVVQPRPKLIIAGSGHMAKAISKVGAILGFRIFVVDPMAEREAFPEAEEVIREFVEDGLKKIKITHSSFIVIVTRHKDDVPALRASLSTNAAYIGMIGSKRRVLQAFELLIKEGFSEEALQRVYAPIGLDIGAETPEEIAISIFAEIIRTMRGADPRPALSKRVSPTLVGKIAQRVVEGEARR